MARPIFLQAGMWFSVGARRRPKGWLAWVILPFAVAIAIWVVVAATYVIMEPWTVAAVFFCSMLVLTFLTVGAFPTSDTTRPSMIDWLLAAASLATDIYFFINATEFTERISLLFPLEFWDVVFATILFVLTLEATRRTTGLGLTVVVLLFVAYNFFGHLLSGVLAHGYISYNHFLDITVYTTDGILGLPVRVAATYAFLFVMFGTVLQYAKGGDFFYDFAAAISGRQAGGPAKVAVISSGLYGMISGSPTSDVVTTGAITIPVMKRLGYSAALAGAIEVAASTGGSIMPPVMGSAAFIMAEYTGVDYRDIAIAAALPAILYYLCIYAQVHFMSVKSPDLKGLDPDKIPGLWPTLKKGGVFLVPLAVLTAALLRGYTPTLVAVYGTIAVLVVALLRRETIVGPIKLLLALGETTMRMVPVAGACAAAGLVIAGITMTGLSAKFGHVVYDITDAHLFSTLLIAAGITVLLGMGMPTPSAYILAAVLMGPVLAQLHVPVLAGHMFLLYYAVMSAVTPPVAVAAYAASSIAEANPLYIAGKGVRLALAAFVVPFAFVYGPELLLIGPAWLTLITFITAAIGLVLLAAAIESYDKLVTLWWTRILLAIGALFLIVPTIRALFIGVALSGVAVAADRWLRRFPRDAAGADSAGFRPD